jgi:hypothetical protein
MPGGKTSSITPRMYFQWLPICVVINAKITSFWVEVPRGRHMSTFLCVCLAFNRSYRGRHVTFLSHQHISLLSRNKFVEPEHETWNLEVCLYSLNEATLLYVNRMMCFVGTWLNAVNFSKNLRKMRLV